MWVISQVTFVPLKGGWPILWPRVALESSTAHRKTKTAIAHALQGGGFSLRDRENVRLLSFSGRPGESPPGVVLPGSV